MKKLLLLLPFALLVSCQEELPENDLLEGKWQPAEIYLDPEASDCEKNTYMEFSPYVFDKKERILRVFDACDSTETLANYTITGDTLILVDSKQVTSRYIIQSITESKWVYIDKGNVIYTFYRLK